MRNRPSVWALQVGRALMVVSLKADLTWDYKVPVSMVVIVVSC